MTELSKYWPVDNELEHCCVNTAESRKGQATLLAVHRPMNFARIREGGSSDRQQATESDLLNSVIAPKESLTDGFKFVVISGYTGVGKSHYITWLNAQIQRHEIANNFHIVWIQKHDTLLTILKSILEPFSDKASFAGILSKLDTAILNTKSNPGYAFQAGLNATIDQKCAEILSEKERLGGMAEPPKEQIRQLGITHAYLAALKNIFNEPDLLDHFSGVNGVFARILNQVIHGKSYENVDDELHLFKVSDLEEAFENITIQELNKRVAIFLESELKKGNDKAGWKYAVELLNSLIDSATNFAFQFSQNMGGKSFRDLLNEIRSELYIQGKELVFLIEDFAAMSGLQNDLLPNFIMGGNTDRGDPICTIRTVLAVTEEFFIGQPETVNHRKDEFIIEQKLSNERDVINFAKDMVGSYLNAARLGSNTLETKMKDALLTIETDDWVPSYANDETDTAVQRDLLNSFGYSPTNKYPLFPFNDAYIENFLRRQSKSGGDLVRSARGIVRNLILETLRGRRQQYLSGSFPPPDLLSVGETIAPSVEAKIFDLKSPEKTRERFKSLIGRWTVGDDNSLEHKQLDLICRAFSLDSLFKELGHIPSPPGPDGGTDDVLKRQEPLPQKGLPKAKEIDPSLKQQIEQWSEAKPLSQSVANTLRNRIASQINDHFSFYDTLIFSGKPRKAEGRIIKIPNAAGDRPNHVFDVGPDRGGRLRNAFISMERAELNRINGKLTFAYLGGYEDRNVIANFIEPLKIKFIEQEMARVRQSASQDGFIVNYISKLRRQDLTQGQITLQENSPESHVKIADWSEFIKKLVFALEPIETSHQRYTGVFQGEGKTVICMNPGQKIDKVTGTDFSNDYIKEHKDFFDYFNDLAYVEKRIASVQGHIEKIAKEIDHFFKDANFRYDQDREDFTKFIVEVAATKNLMPVGFQVRDLESYFTSFDGFKPTSVAAWLESLRDSTKDQSSQIKMVGSADLNLWVKVHSACLYLQEFYTALESLLPTENIVVNDSLEEAKQATKNILAKFDVALNDGGETVQSVSE